MRILINEIRKILTLKMLLLLAIVNCLFFSLLIQFYIEYFPNLNSEHDLHSVSIEMLDKYGADIDKEEFADFKQTYKAKVIEVEDYLQSRNGFVDAGIKSYQDLKNYNRENEEINALLSRMNEEDIVETVGKLQAREYIIDSYEKKGATLDSYVGQKIQIEKVRTRLDELKKAGQFKIYPAVVIENYKDFIFNVAIAIIFSVVIVISPIFMKDRSTKMLDVQYTMKKGRNLYKTKVTAGLISAFVVITVLLIIYFSIYSLNNTAMFFEVLIHKFIEYPSWYDPTFFQYIVLTVIAIYILGFIFALLAMALSSIMPNYIALIGIQIPLVIAMIAKGLFYLMRLIISMTVPQWLVPTTYSIMLVISAVFIILMWKREKKRDILL